jgi:hypothetical protein
MPSMKSASWLTVSSVKISFLVRYFAGSRTPLQSARFLCFLTQSRLQVRAEHLGQVYLGGLMWLSVPSVYTRSCNWTSCLPYVAKVLQKNRVITKICHVDCFASLDMEIMHTQKISGSGRGPVA